MYWYPLTALFTSWLAAGLALGVVTNFSANRLSAQSPPVQSSESRFAITRSDEGVLITEQGEEVLFYQQRTKSLKGRYARENYVHPLYSLDGEVLTEDFPDDHLHHRGIFWAWHQLWVGDRRVGDPWVARDFAAEVESIEVLEDDPGSVQLLVNAVWTSPEVQDASGQPLPLVRERTTLRVHRRSAELRLIDFEIGLQALANKVRIGGSDDEKGYGGFSVRVRLPEDLTFTGSGGKVQPQVGAVDAGPWLNLATSSWGLAILTHPSNPGFPHPWILRQQRSMQNPVYPGREPVAVPQDEPLVLRYRLVLHRGQLEPSAIDQLQRRYQRASQ